MSRRPGSRGERGPAHGAWGGAAGAAARPGRAGPQRGSREEVPVADAQARPTGLCPGPGAAPAVLGPPAATAFRLGLMLEVGFHWEGTGVAVTPSHSHTALAAPARPPGPTCVLLWQHGPVHHLAEGVQPRALLRLRLTSQQEPALRRDDGDAVWPVVALGGLRESVQHRVAALPAADEDLPSGKGVLRAARAEPLRPPGSGLSRPSCAQSGGHGHRALGGSHGAGREPRRTWGRGPCLPGGL